MPDINQYLIPILVSISDFIIQDFSNWMKWRVNFLNQPEHFLWPTTCVHILMWLWNLENFGLIWKCWKYRWNKQCLSYPSSGSAVLANLLLIVHNYIHLTLDWPWEISTPWTLHQFDLFKPTEPLEPMNQRTSWTLIPNELIKIVIIEKIEPFTNWTLELFKLLPQFPFEFKQIPLLNKVNPKLMKLLNQLRTLTNWTIEPIEPLNQLNPWTNWTLEPIDPLIPLSPQTNRSIESIEPLNHLKLQTN